MSLRDCSACLQSVRGAASGGRTPQHRGDDVPAEEGAADPSQDGEGNEIHRKRRIVCLTPSALVVGVQFPKQRWQDGLKY